LAMLRSKAGAQYCKSRDWVTVIGLCTEVVLAVEIGAQGGVGYTPRLGWVTRASHPPTGSSLRVWLGLWDIPVV